MSKQFWAVIAIVILIFVGIFFVSNNSNSSSGGTNSSAKASNHTLGTSAHNITLVEYGDYQCPFCGQYFPILKQIQAEYNDKIVFQFRNYPLTQIHQNAFAGSRAAEAAALQNKFWEMHDILYQQNELSQQGQSNWVSSSNPLTFFDQYATQLGLNINKFNSDFNSNQINGAINADVAAGNAASQAVTHKDIQGTPTFFLDGKIVSVGESAASFESVINKEIAKKTGQSTPATTTPSAGTGSTAQTKSTTKAQ